MSPQEAEIKSPSQNKVRKIQMYWTRLAICRNAFPQGIARSIMWRNLERPEESDNSRSLIVSLYFQQQSNHSKWMKL